MSEKRLNFISKDNGILKEELRNHISRKYFRHLKSINARFLVNGKETKLHENVIKGDKLEIIAEEMKLDSSWPIIEESLDIIYENEHYLIVNKRGDLLTIPTKSEPRSLYQLLTQYLGQKEIHILNRLDKETRGLCVIAKDRYAAYLMQPTHMHMVRKYLCLVHGKVEKDGQIENYIAKSNDSNKRFVSLDGCGKLAISKYKVIEQFEEKTLLEFELETGRTHQIRVHTSNMGNPIIGDNLYGNDENQELMLASYYVCFIDPFTKEKIEKVLMPGW